MSFRTNYVSPGVLLPEELAVVEGVYDAVSARPWFTDDEQARQAFAAFVIESYHRGLTDREKLLDFCETAAMRKFRKNSKL